MHRRGRCRLCTSRYPGVSCWFCYCLLEKKFVFCKKINKWKNIYKTVQLSLSVNVCPTTLVVRVDIWEISEAQSFIAGGGGGWGVGGWGGFILTSFYTNFTITSLFYKYLQKNKKHKKKKSQIYRFHQRCSRRPCLAFSLIFPETHLSCHGTNA